jgi:hypothetical protein
MKALIEFQALKKVGFLLLPYRGESSFVFVLEADVAGGISVETVLHCTICRILQNTYSVCFSVPFHRQRLDAMALEQRFYRPPGLRARNVGAERGPTPFYSFWGKKNFREATVGSHRGLSEL